MIVQIIALTSKGEDALRRYIDSSDRIEKEMASLSSLNPKRIKFNMEQASAKRIVSEEWFDNPLRIVATIKPKFESQAYVFVPRLQIEFEKIMLNSNCGKNDYSLEVI